MMEMHGFYDRNCNFWDDILCRFGQTLLESVDIIFIHKLLQKIPFRMNIKINFHIEYLRQVINAADNEEFYYIGGRMKKIPCFELFKAYTRRFSYMLGDIPIGAHILDEAIVSPSFYNAELEKIIKFMLNHKMMHVELHSLKAAVQAINTKILTLLFKHNKTSNKVLCQFIASNDNEYWSSRHCKYLVLKKHWKILENVMRCRINQCDNEKQRRIMRRICRIFKKQRNWGYIYGVDELKRLIGSSFPTAE